MATAGGAAVVPGFLAALALVRPQGEAEAGPVAGQPKRTRTTEGEATGLEGQAPLVAPFPMIAMAPMAAAGQASPAGGAPLLAAAPAAPSSAAGMPGPGGAASQGTGATPPLAGASPAGGTLAGGEAAAGPGTADGEPGAAPPMPAALQQGGAARSDQKAAAMDEAGRQTRADAAVQSLGAAVRPQVRAGTAGPEAMRPATPGEAAAALPDGTATLLPDAVEPAATVLAPTVASGDPARVAAVHQAVRAGPASPAAQIHVQIERAVADGGPRSFTVHLEPEELGRVEVKLEFQDGRLHALVMADRPQTLDLLQRDARLLERSIEQGGLRLQQDGLQFSLREGGGQNGGQGGWQGGDPLHRGARLLAAVGETAGSTDPVRTLAADGLIDIQV
ncbi:flagellar hook-length control protein FliK [Rhodocista pekingensis]|uniref:Flagellar hook-length control protein FliK n=1 Tax=Rhodocista pekingensis TaxID=201185 RepID=A0ABW2L0U9_9PROT